MPSRHTLIALDALIFARAVAWEPPRYVSSRWPSCGSWGARIDKITAALREAAKRNRGGNAVVIGANTGPGPGGVDPMFDWLSGNQAASLLDKVFFVEPVPLIFRILQHNLLKARHTVPLNFGIANESATLDIYCLGLATEDEASNSASNKPPTLRLSEEAAKLGVPGWATMTCSLNRGRLFSTSDFARGGRFGGLKAMANRTAYEALITKHAVPVITFARLMQEHVRGRVLYLQVDVEGRDDEVVLQALDTIPTTELPVAITFEISVIAAEKQRVLRVMDALSKTGYSLCYGMKNVVAHSRSLVA